MKNAIMPVLGQCVWQIADLVEDDSWCMPWRESELDILKRAVSMASESGRSWQNIDQVSFPLPGLDYKLKSIVAQLESGRGVVKLTGLPVADFSEAELRLLWMGLARHLGVTVHQDFSGQLMRDIRDEGGDLGARYQQLDDPLDGAKFLSSKARTYGPGELRFHTDRTDVVALLSVGQAMSGGDSKIVSSPAVHNAMLEQCPELLAHLYQPIFRSRLGEEIGGENQIYPLPVFGIREGQFTSHFSRTYIEAGQLQPGTPKMTDSQWAALDKLAELAERLCYTMRLVPGDMQFLNNHVVYHARTAFSDNRATGQSRLLYRIWLCMPGNRPLPADHAVLWGNVEANTLRGGIGLK